MGDSIPLHAWEPAVVARDRERTLRVVLPIVAAACAIGAFIIPKGPQAHAFDPYMFGFAGIGLLAVWVLLRQRLMPYGAASALCVMVAGALPAARVLSLFTGGVFDDPRVSLMNSIYAYFPIYFTLLSLLVPFPRSAWLGAGVWLVVAGGTTALTRPYWGDTPVRSGLLPTLALVWAGYPIYLVLVLGAARRHSRMVEMYASKARAAEDANAAAGQNAARFQSIFSLAAVGMAMRDPRGRWLSVNQRVCDITGYSADELLRTDFQSLTHPDDLNADVALAGKVMRGEIPTYSMEKRYIRKDGTTIWVKLFVSRMDGATRAEDRFVTVIEDISQRKATEEHLARLHGELEQRVAERTLALQESGARWRERNATLSATNELISFLPSACDEQEACRLATTYMPRIMAGTSGVLWLASEADDGFAGVSTWGTPAARSGTVSKNSCWAARRSQPHCVPHGEPGMRCAHYADATGEFSSVCEPLIVDGKVLGILSVEWPAAGAHAPETDAVVLKSVGEQLALALSNIHLRAELQALSTRDPLTGLHNRRHLAEHLPRVIAAARRARTAVSVLLADVDHFKQFNDCFGHEAGDRVLKAVAGAMGRTLRAGDLAFRHGGEEFVAVLSDCRPEEALRWAERLRAAIADASAQADPDGQMPPITCSVGVASFPADGATTDQLLAAADKAMYEAKSAGRNCVRILKAA